uniref:Uncharacterized protein n=1 Tax=Romanomermis culicivorax TaxID=13658 RepID=A0A915K460_ROMCU
MVLDLLAFTCILPLFPSLMDYYAMKSNQGDLYHTLTTVLKSFQNFIGAPQNYRYNSVLFGGFLGSMFSFLQFCSSPVVGAISDVKGRKPLLLVSTVRHKK